MDAMSYDSTGQYTHSLMATDPQLYSSSVGSVTQQDVPPLTGAPSILQSLPPGCPIPEAIKMQMMYDNRKQNEGSECLESDPNKLSQMMKFDQDIDPSLQSDPAKEQAMSEFDHQYANAGALKIKRSDSVERVIDELDKVKLGPENPSNSRKNSFVKEEIPVSGLPRKNSCKETEYVNSGDVMSGQGGFNQSASDQPQTEDVAETETEQVEGATANPDVVVPKPERGMFSFFEQYEKAIKEEMDEEEEYYEEGEYDGEDYEDYDDGDVGEFYDEDSAYQIQQSEAVSSEVSGCDVNQGSGIVDYKEQAVVSHDPCEGRQPVYHNAAAVAYHPCPIETSESVEEDCAMSNDDEEALFGSITDCRTGNVCDGRVSMEQSDVMYDHNALHLQHKFLAEKRTTEPTEGECFV